MFQAQFVGVVGVLVLLGCGGSKPAIEHRVAMEKLWQTPAEARQAVVEAHRSVYVTRASLEHTRFLHRDAKSELAIARAERKRARMGAQIAELEKKRRAAGFLTTLADVAARQIEVSRKEAAVLERKIGWLDARIKYLAVEVAHLEAEVEAAEARFELAKAKLAVERGFAGKEFKLTPFEAQAQRTASRASAQRQSAEQARGRAQSKRKAWRSGN